MADVESLELRRIFKELGKLSVQMTAVNRARAEFLRDGYYEINPDGCVCDQTCARKDGECPRMEQWNDWLIEVDSCHAEVLASIAYTQGRLTDEEYEWIGGALQG